MTLLRSEKSRAHEAACTQVLRSASNPVFEVLAPVEAGHRGNVQEYV